MDKHDSLAHSESKQTRNRVWLTSGILSRNADCLSLQRIITRLPRYHFMFWSNRVNYFQAKCFWIIL